MSCIDSVMRSPRRGQHEGLQHPQHLPGHGDGLGGQGRTRVAADAGHRHAERHPRVLLLGQPARQAATAERRSVATLVLLLLSL